MRKSLAFLALIIITLGCGHKAAPLAKDRLRPSLKKITALNNRQLLFTFSEVISVKSLTPDQIRINSINDTLDTLPVLMLYPSLSDAEVVLITAPQSAVEYRATGSVFDTSGNKGNFQKSFSGTNQPDTIVPEVVAYRQGKNNRFFMVQFNEAMDTTEFEFLVLPRKQMSAIWPDCRRLVIQPKDSSQTLGQDTTYCCWLRRVLDLSRNALPSLTITITPDTSYQPLYIRGHALAADTLLKTGVAVLSLQEPLAISLLQNGNFNFEVRDSLTYRVDIFSAGQHGYREIQVGREDTILVLPDTINLDRFIR